MDPKNFIKIYVSSVHQNQDGGNGKILLGKINFKYLDLIHKFTARKENLLDPFDKKDIKKILSEENDFQRTFNKPKLKKMEKFLKDNYNKKRNPLGLFPTSLIISLQLYEYDENKLSEEFMEMTYNKEKFLNKCFINENLTELFIPRKKLLALIVDGQHRFKSVQNFFETLKDEEFIENFEFPVTFLLGFDPHEVAKIFATVNFTQKPVNRSIYFDIFGSVPDEFTEIKLAHDLALHLNNNEDSPLRNMIKLLGKGNGLFSQAFFVKKMFIHINEKKGVWKEIFLDYKKGGNKYKELPKFMKIYLNCIKKVYIDCWVPDMIQDEEGNLFYDLNNKDNPYEYILCKPTGMGAFFRLINEIYPLVKNLSEQKMEEKIIKILEKIPLERAKKLFSSDIDAPYSKTSSEGVVSKLYGELKGLYGFK